jgi:hypothetical protein
MRLINLLKINYVSIPALPAGAGGNPCAGLAGQL